MSARRRQRERGSALLIVFVFAAMIAIMLYAEMPVAVFEAKRQKEQLLIDRGNEYAHAVKLYVRKFGTYPSTVEQLENTNRMRFLRHRFKDPFTGKDNWRMLHAGPGGQLTDSKVKPAGLDIPGSIGAGSASNSGPATASGFGSSSSGSFGSNTGSSFGSNTGSSFGSSGSNSVFGESSSSSSSQAEAVVVPDVPQRPPAISASGAPSTAGSSANSAEGEQGLTSAAGDDLRQQMTMVEQGQAGAAAENGGQPGNGGPGASGEPGASAVQGQQNQPAENNANAAASANGAAGAQNATQMVRNMMGSGNPAIGAALTGSAGMGQISGGGIAGVASIAKGHTIKVINDQTDYSLWEFYYDPSKDATRNMLSVSTGAQGQAVQGANGGSTGQSMFGQSNSGFGQSNSALGQSNSSFGQSNTNFGQSNPGGTATQSNPQQ